MDKRLVSVREAAALLSIGKTSLYEMVEAGTFPARRLGRVVSHSHRLYQTGGGSGSPTGGEA